MRGKIVAGLCLASFIYTLFGAMLLYFSERKGQNAMRRELISDLRQFIGNHSCVSWKALFMLLDSVSVSYNKDIVLSAEDLLVEWSYADSVLLATSTISTVGFGSYRPSTTIGRTTCVVYVILGIPLLLASVTALGEKILTGLRAVNLRMESGKGEGMNFMKYCLLRLRYLIATVCAVLMLVFVPAIIVNLDRESGFSKSLYATFIVMSTVGLANTELVPSVRSHFFWLAFLVFCGWLYFALVFVFLLLQTTNRLFTRYLEDDITLEPSPIKEYTTFGVSQCSRELFGGSGTPSLSGSTLSLANAT